MANEGKGMSPRRALNMESKHNPKNTAIKSGAQIGIIVVGGSLATAVLGKWSFLTGLGLVGLGNYKDVSWLAPLGTGMMASALMLPDEPDSTTPFSISDEATKAKTRIVSLKDSFLSKTYLNKVFTSSTSSSAKDSGKKAAQRSNGEEEDGVNGIDDLSADTETLDRIEQQLIASAREFQKKQAPENRMDGVEPDPMGLNGEVDFSSM